jgi:tRNA pseudouridine38-40 synthase
MFEGRIRMVVRYDGTDFSGSQIQPGKRTVQGTLKAELERISGHEVSLVFASRTDSGVHADGNVCACDLRLSFPPARLAQMLNIRLPRDLRVRESRKAEASFNPRFEATSRAYIYRIHRGADVPVDKLRFVCPHSGEWREAEVASCLEAIRGEHSFNRFAEGSLTSGHSICEVYEAGQRRCDEEIELGFKANRFLRAMVCRLSGALIAVATGRMTATQFRDALDGAETLRFKPAPPRGLVLRQVSYPGESGDASEKKL